jgi:hypothetical protein
MLGRLPVATRLRRCTASPTWTNLTERAAIARSLLMEAEASDLEVYLSVRENARPDLLFVNGGLPRGSADAASWRPKGGCLSRMPLGV